ncbi:unnamed protein product [Schistocephalus solidus]|uniref:Vps8 domain-containing protein n=1 Tax=Schistocephalus solidus TaxID=70667 RepID=A0A183SQK7_SCHSO|nr:unnamed protein product [Schistocephalus solidus]
MCCRFQESDLASDIEADLQELSIDDHSFNTSERLSVHSNASTFGSFSGSEELTGGVGIGGGSARTSLYLRTASLRNVFTQLMNFQVQSGCGSPSCVCHNIVKKTGGEIGRVGRQGQTTHATHAWSTNAGPVLYTNEKVTAGIPTEWDCHRDHLEKKPWLPDSPSEEEDYCATCFEFRVESKFVAVPDGGLQLAERMTCCGHPSFQCYLAVGTTNGYIFIFDRHQVLQLCLNTGFSKGSSAAENVGAGQGPITALSQNLSGSRLLASFSSGRIAMWQLPPPANTDTNTDAPALGDLQQAGNNDLLASSFSSSSSSSATTRLSERVGLSGKIGTSSLLSAAMLLRARRSSSALTITRKSSDPANSDLLRVVDDAHQIGQSVILCAFTTLPTVAVCVDSGGSVYQLSFSHGEICAMEPLRPASTKVFLRGIHTSSSKNDPNVLASRLLYQSALVAMASFTKIIVVVLRPRLRVVSWHHLKGQPSCLPLLAWNWFSPEHSDGNTAFLIFGRSSTVYIAQLTVCLSSETPRMSIDSVEGQNTTGPHKAPVSLQHPIQFDVLRTINFDYRMISLQCLGTDHLAIVDSDEVLRLFEISTKTEVETKNISSVQMCYNSSSFKAVAIGGLVSEALASASERACTNSIAIASGQMVVLGRTGLFVYSLKDWNDRVNSLIGSGRTNEALKTCLQVLEAAPAGGKSSLCTCILEFLRYVFSSNEATSIPRFSANTIGLAVKLCVCLDQIDFLQTVLFPRLQADTTAMDSLLSNLCSLLLQLPPLYKDPNPSADTGSVALRHLSPDLVMELLKWCLSSHSPPSLSVSSLPSASSCLADADNLPRGRNLAEACLQRLAPTSLAIDLTVKFCSACGLYEGLSYIYCFILRDHATAFRWLTNILLHEPVESAERAPNMSSQAFSSKPVNQTEAVNSTLLFLRAIFAGEEFFGSPLPSELREDVQNEIFNLLLSPSLSSIDLSRGMLLNLQSLASPATATIGDAETSSASPTRLTVLLRLGAVDLVNMLTLILREAFFSPPVNQWLQRRRRLFYALASSLLESPDTSLDLLAPALYFLSQQLLLPENRVIAFDRQKLDILFERLCEVSKASRSASAASDGLCESLFQLHAAGLLMLSEDQLNRAQAAGLYDLCEKVYESRGNPVAVLACRISILQRSLQQPPVCGPLLAPDASVCVSRIFDFVNSCLFGEWAEASANHLTLLIDKVLGSVELLATCDALRCLILLMQCLGPSMRRILFALDAVFMSDSKSFINQFVTRRREVDSWKEEENDPYATLAPAGPHHPSTPILLNVFYELRSSLDSALDRDLALSGLSSVPGDVTLRLFFERFLTRSDPCVAEFFIVLLLAGGERERLRHFLATNEEYRADFVIEAGFYLTTHLLDEESYPSELACVYEKIGDTQRASKLAQTDFLSHWTGLVACCSPSTVSEAEQQSTFSQAAASLRSSADRLFALSAHRCVARRDLENEAYWYAIIDLLFALRKQEQSDRVLSELNSIFHSMLKAASPYVPIPSLIKRVLKVSFLQYSVKLISYFKANDCANQQLFGLFSKKVSNIYYAKRFLFYFTTENGYFILSGQLTSSNPFHAVCITGSR